MRVDRRRNPYKEIGQILKRRREELGLKQAAVAYEAEIDRFQVTKFETGERLVPRKHAVALLTALQFDRRSLEHLLGRIELVRANVTDPSMCFLPAQINRILCDPIVGNAAYDALLRSVRIGTVEDYFAPTATRSAVAAIHVEAPIIKGTWVRVERIDGSMFRQMVGTPWICDKPLRSTPRTGDAITLRLTEPVTRGDGLYDEVIVGEPFDTSDFPPIPRGLVSRLESQASDLREAAERQIGILLQNRPDTISALRQLVQSHSCTPVTRIRSANILIRTGYEAAVTLKYVLVENLSDKYFRRWLRYFPSADAVSRDEWNQIENVLLESYREATRMEDKKARDVIVCRCLRVLRNAVPQSGILSDWIVDVWVAENDLVKSKCLLTWKSLAQRRRLTNYSRVLEILDRYKNVSGGNLEKKNVNVVIDTIRKDL